MKAENGLFRHGGFGERSMRPGEPTFEKARFFNVFLLFCEKKCLHSDFPCVIILSGLLRKEDLVHESKIFSKTDLREVQSHQEKGKHPHHLRESQAQTETGLILVAMCVSL